MIKASVRVKFVFAILFFFMVIAALSILSSYHFIKLSQKTNAILKENRYSIAYARQMSEQLTMIDYILFEKTDQNKAKSDIEIKENLGRFNEALSKEKQIITEPGEGQLVNEIEQLFTGYSESLKFLSKSFSQNVNHQGIKLQHLAINKKLILLSQINEDAIETKTDAAKFYVNKALWQVGLTATVGLLIAMSFAFNFASYFYGRFSDLYNGLKEVTGKNYSQRIHIEGKDEFAEISQIINEMAGKLERQQEANKETDLQKNNRDEMESTINEMKFTIEQMKRIEGQAKTLITRLEKQQQ